MKKKGKGFEMNDATEHEDEAVSEEPEESPVEEQKVEQQPEPEPETEEEEAQTGGDVYSLIQWVILMLTESAWQWMGLHPNPVTKKIEKDMGQVKLAIDAVVYLTDQIAPHVSEDQRRTNRTLVSDLRVNFVQKSQID